MDNLKKDLLKIILREVEEQQVKIKEIILEDYLQKRIS
jgi:hypothetical protein